MFVPVRVAACHVSPIFLAAKATTEKAMSLINEAVRNKANLVVFPETYISAFPVWSSLRPPTENHDLFKRMVAESVYADGEEISCIRSLARQTKTMVSIGVSEKIRSSSATLYNSNLIIGQDGEVLVHHRKLMPTFFEKLTWSPGDGHGLRVAITPFGKIGNLICGENTNPLARYSLMAQGEQIHISTWPAVWPTRLSKRTPEDSTNGFERQVSPPSAPRTAKEAANYDNVAANRTRAAAHCFEAKCFGVLCSGVLDARAIEIMSSDCSNGAAVKTALQESQRGATMFLDPTGTLLTGFTINDTTGAQEPTEVLQHEEGILYADLDVSECVEGKQYHDVVGGYQRLDVFELKVNRSRREPATFVDSGPELPTSYVKRDMSSSAEEH